jgi:hypothetical protein
MPLEALPLTTLFKTTASLESRTSAAPYAKKIPPPPF